VPLDVALIEVPMVKRRDWKAPGKAALDDEAGVLAGAEEIGAGIAAEVPRPGVAWAEAFWTRRDGEGEDSVRTKDAGDLPEGRAVVHVLEHLAENGCVEAPVGEGQRRHVRLDDLSGNGPAQDAEGGRLDVSRYDVEAALLEEPRERPLSRSGVQHACAGLAREKEVE
jgi:hypothetical protein